MATGGDRFSDSEYINWLRTTLALMYMKEGLEEFTNNESGIFHKQLVKYFGKAAQPCKQNCCSTDIKKDFRNGIWRMTCPVCNSWMQSVISFHRNYPFPNMSPTNTHPKLWQTKPWETMKLFLPFGCETDESARDADIQGILSLFINCRHFSTGVYIGRQDLLDKLLGIRNSLLHSANFKVSETEVKSHFQTVLLFMKGMTGLTGSDKETLQAAVEKVQQLEANQIEISVNRELELQALKERQVALERDLRALVDVTQKEQDKQRTEVKQHTDTLKQLKAANEQFEEFLKTNDLVHDVSKLSKRLGDIDQTNVQHAERIRGIGQTVAQHAERMGDIGQTNAQHANRIEDIDQTNAQHAKRIIDIAQTVIHHTERMGDIAQIFTQHAERMCLLDQKQVQADTVTDSLSWDNQCTVLLRHLLHMYGKRKFWENPVSSEEEFLSQMYVQPSVKFSREIDDHGMLAEVKQEKSASSKLTYVRMFSSKTGPCENIYLTGDAGKGKTTFCNQLLLQWCNAVQNIQTETISSDDLKEIASFRFLFHINLRDTESIYHVEDMIQEQLLSNAPVALNISKILNTERCLIVLDGLDEWSCPDDAKKCPNINKHIPGRNTANKNCVFITTTRNWKYDVIALKNNDIDKHLEFSGIAEEESVELAKRMLDHLDRDLKSNKKVDDFFSEIEEKNLDDFLSVPVLLIQLITLWCFGKDFGNSQLQLYCSMLELLFERSEKNLPEEISKCSCTTVASPRKLPECFSTKDNCQMYAELLHCLANLAYKALFNKQKEKALVFKSSRLEIFGISPSDIKLCLHCGILSQCTDYGNKTGKYKKFSFLHKKVQECLAALFLVSHDNVEDILKEVKQVCNSVETMLEMNQVWLFVAGMDPDLTRRLLECLGNVVSGSDLVKTYRQTVDSDGFSDSGRLIERIQSCTFDCLSEGINNGLHYENLCLEDFSINGSNVHDVQRLLLCSDMSKVKSVRIYTLDIDTAKIADITGHFQQCRSLQKLDLSNPWSSRMPDSTVAALIKSNCDSLTSIGLTEIKTTDTLVTDMCSSISKSLMALRLYGVKLTHEHKEQILHNLSQSPAIRQIDLYGLNCTRHGFGCRSRIDWSTMAQLQELTLKYMYVDNLQSLPHCVEKVQLWNVTLPVTSLCDLIQGLTQTRRKLTVELDVATFTETREECGNLEGFLRSCPVLKVTKCKYFTHFNSWSIKFHISSQQSLKKSL